MNGPLNNPTDLSLAPLGAGDLIDRAVRLYRRHFLTLIRIAAPPVIVFALGSSISTIGTHAIGVTPSTTRLLFYLFMIVTGVVIMIAGALFSLIVMGGATPNLVAHLLWDEPVSFRATYAAVKSRFWGLLAASFLVAAWLAFCAGIAFTAFYIVFALILIAAFAVGSIGAEWLIAIISIIGTLAALTLATILFFLLAGHVAYVPQAMMVEGRTVTSAIGS